MGVTVVEECWNLMHECFHSILNFLGLESTAGMWGALLDALSS